MQNFKKGDRVIYLNCSDEQVNWELNDDPRNVLIEGCMYYVEKVEVHSSHTKITLRNIYGRFNSICFSKV